MNEWLLNNDFHDLLITVGPRWKTPDEGEALGAPQEYSAVGDDPYAGALKSHREIFIGVYFELFCGTMVNYSDRQGPSSHLLNRSFGFHSALSRFP